MRMIHKGRVLRRTTPPDNELTSRFKDERLTAVDGLEALFPAFNALQGRCQ